MNKYLLLAALFGLLAVIIGAFGAHTLEKSLTVNALARYHTGVEYQFYHVFALLGVGILTQQAPPSRLLQIAGTAFAMGIVLFSGSLYLYALTGITKFGMITPIGGLSFIIAWFCLLIYAIKTKY